MPSLIHGGPFGPHYELTVEEFKALEVKAGQVDELRKALDNCSHKLHNAELHSFTWDICSQPKCVEVRKLLEGK